MTIYDESGRVMEAPDLSAGWVEQKRRLVASHQATEAVTHLEVMPGTDGLRRLVVDTPARDAWDEYETYGVYHPYTEEELASMNAPTAEQRLDAAEAAILELASMIAAGGE